MNKSNNIVIILAAGKGTRMKSDLPKVLHTINNKPMICNVIETAKKITPKKIIVIVGYKKDMVIEAVNDDAITYVIQKEQKGLGHALLCAEEFVGDSPFAVLLGDTICTGEPNCTKGLIDIFDEKNRSVFAVGKIEKEETRRYGVISGKEISDGLRLVDNLVEKPGPNDAPSLLGILGRYVFTPDIFEYQRSIGVGTSGEIQLTDAMQLLSQKSEIFSWTFNGKRYDIGNMRDWFQSHIELSANSKFSPILDSVVKKL